VKLVIATVLSLLTVYPYEMPVGTTRIWTFPLDVFPPGRILPGTFPLPDNSPSLCIRCRTFPHFHHQHPSIYTIKRSTVNVYQTDSGRSVRVRSTGYCQFSNFRLNSCGNVLNAEGNCPWGICQSGNVPQSLRVPVQPTTRCQLVRPVTPSDPCRRSWPPRRVRGLL